MPVSQSSPSPSIDVSCLPRCGGAGGSDRSLSCAPCIRAQRIRGGGASCSRERERVARFSGRRVWTTGLCGWDGQSWFRVPATTIMTTLGPVTYKRARHGAHQTSLVPVDESLGLVNDYLTRPAARLALMMGYGTAREAEAFFSEMGAMTPSASTLQRLACGLHERWEGLGPQAMDAVRDREDIPPEAVSASVSLDGVMVALRAGEDGRDQACWRELRHGLLPRRRR